MTNFADEGFALVVTKLFNIIQPHKAYFGQKDGIQCIVIKTLVRDLNFPLQVIIGETIRSFLACIHFRVCHNIRRESDGLAMSSRNSYLSPDERKVTAPLHRRSAEFAGIDCSHFVQSSSGGTARIQNKECCQRKLTP